MNASLVESQRSGEKILNESNNVVVVVVFVVVTLADVVFVFDVRLVLDKSAEDFDKIPKRRKKRLIPFFQKVKLKVFLSIIDFQHWEKYCRFFIGKMNSTNETRQLLLQYCGEKAWICENLAKMLADISKSGGQNLSDVVTDFPGQGKTNTVKPMFQGTTLAISICTPTGADLTTLNQDLKKKLKKAQKLEQKIYKLSAILFLWLQPFDFDKQMKLKGAFTKLMNLQQVRFPFEQIAYRTLCIYGPPSN